MPYLLFSIMMILIYIRPLQIPAWLISTFGALVAFLCGIVDIDAIVFVWAMVWDSTLVLVGLIVLTLTLERLLFFEFLAHWILVFASTSVLENGQQGFYCKTWKLFIFLIFFGAFLATFFANDGAILVLTPLMFAVFSQQKEGDNAILLIFLLCMAFISDFASNLFVISNLTNILTASFFAIPFLDFLKYMALPQIFAICSSLAIFWLFYGRKLPKTLVVSKDFKNKSLSTFGICFCFSLLALLPLCAAFGAYFRIPLCIFVGLCAALALGYGMKLGRIKPFKLLKSSPFSVVPFSLGLFIVVFGLKNAGLLEVLETGANKILEQGTLLSLFGIGFLSAFGSSLINNLPMVMLGDLTLKSIDNLHLVFAHLLGCNIGSKLTPIGSLATLLWLASLKKYGISIPLHTYLYIAFCWTIFVLFCAILGLYLGILIELN